MKGIFIFAAQRKHDTIATDDARYEDDRRVRDFVTG